MAAAPQPAEPRQWIPLQKQLLPKTKEASSQHQRNARRRHREAIENALRKGHLKVLDRELILDSQLQGESGSAALGLRDVVRISLSGSHVQAVDDIAVLSCARLRLCNLEACYLSDISAFYGCVNLLRLDVSNNQIEFLPHRDFWSSLTSLRVLYLSGNVISRQECLSHLSACPALHILTLYDTPISLMKTYRHHVVNSILTLKALDHHVISDEEIIENLHVSSSFKPLTPNLRLQLHQTSPKGTTFKEEVRAVYRLLLAIDRVLARYSPVVVMQRWVRGWLVRKALAKSSNPTIRLFVKKPRIGHLTQHSNAPAKTVRIRTEPQIVPMSSPAHSSPGHRRKPKRTCSDHVAHSTPLPPPPPTSPVIASPRRDHRAPKQGLPLPLETHVLGMDTDSSKLKYSMHINLHKLHQNVLEADGSEGEAEFRSAFQRMSPSKPVAVVKPTKRSKESPPKKGKSERSGPKTPVKDTTTPKVSAKTNDTDGHPEQTKVGEPELKPGRAGITTEEPLPTEDLQGIGVTGRTVQAVPHDYIAAMEISNKDSGRTVRDAEKEIKETVAKTRQPLSRPEITRNPKVLTKDEMAFTRTYATMTLSAVRALERAHESRKKAEKLIQKTDLVSKMKQERVERRGKIEGFHRELRDSVISWKESEDSRLAQLREKQHTKKTKDFLKAAQQHDTTVTGLHKQTENMKFACEFNQQHTLVGVTLATEDQQQSKDAKLLEIQARVQQAREVSQEHQEMVRKYMELRKSKLLQEGTSIKKDLDTKMIEAVSHRLMEARKKVAREVARKQAARATIALAKEELKGVDHCLPSHPHTTLRMDLSGPDGIGTEGDPRPRMVGRLQEHRTPVSMRRFSREAHRTWQRGALVITERQAAFMGSKGHTHFPLLSPTEETPLMYEMMRPGPMLQSIPATPGDTESTASSPSGSASLAHHQLTVQ